MWSCATCTLQNPARKRRCDACGVRRAVDTDLVAATTSAVQVLTEPSAAPNRTVHREQTDAPSRASRSNCRSKKRSTSSVKGWLRTKKRQRSQQDGRTGNDEDDADSGDTFSYSQPPLVAILDERNFTVHLKMNGNWIHADFAETLVILPPNSAAASSESCSAQPSAPSENVLVEEKAKAVAEHNPADRFPTITDKDVALLASGAEHPAPLQTSAMDVANANGSSLKRQRLQTMRSGDKMEDSTDTSTTATPPTDNTPTDKSFCAKNLCEGADGGSEPQLHINTNNLHSVKRLKKADPSASTAISHSRASDPQLHANGAASKNQDVTQKECPQNAETETNQQGSEPSPAADRSVVFEQSICSDDSTCESTSSTLVEPIDTATGATARTNSEKLDRCTEGEMSSESGANSNRAAVAVAKEPEDSPCSADDTGKSFENSSKSAVENGQQRFMLSTHTSETLVAKPSAAPPTEDDVGALDLGPETWQEDLDDDDDGAVDANSSLVLPPQATSSADLVGIVAPSNDETIGPVVDENSMKENERCDENVQVSSDGTTSVALKEEELHKRLAISDGVDLDQLLRGRSENGNHKISFSTEQTATAPERNADPGTDTLATNDEGPSFVAANNSISQPNDAGSKSPRRESGRRSGSTQKGCSSSGPATKERCSSANTANSAASLENKSGGCDEQTTVVPKRSHTDRDESFASGFFYTPTTQSQESQTESSEVPKSTVRTKDSAPPITLATSSMPSPLRNLNAPADPQASSLETDLFASDQILRNGSGGNVPLATTTTSECHLAAEASSASLTHRGQQLGRKTASICATNQTATSGTLRQTWTTATAANKIPLQSKGKLGVNAIRKPPSTALSALKASSFLRGDSSPDSVDSAGPLTFQTAGLGHKISVSDQSLANASKLLQGSSLCEPLANATLDLEAKSTEKLTSFRTAGRGLTINVSEDALARGEKLLFQSQYACNDRCAATVKPARALENNPAGQSIASVPEDALARGEKLLEENGRESRPSFESTSVAFATAGLGQRITVSSASMQRAQKLLASKGLREGENALESTVVSSTGDVAFTSATNKSEAAIYPRHSTESESGFQPVTLGFQTAGSGNQISVSASSLSKAKNLLLASIDETHSNENAPALVFQTAGVGKTISVSDASLAKANTLLCSPNTNSHSHPLPAPCAGHPMDESFSAPDLLKEVDNQLKRKPVANREQYSSLSSVTGSETVSRAVFHTAGLGEEVTVSATRLADAARFLKGTEEGFVSMSRPIEEEYVADNGSYTKNSESNESPQSSSTARVSFQTAGLGKIVSVSPSRLAEANKLLNSAEDEPPSTATMPTAHAAPDEFQAFGHEQYQRYESPTSIAERAQCFGKKDREESLQFSNLLSVSFQTGLGNKILVPASSIAEAEKFLNSGEDLHHNQEKQRQNEERSEEANCRPAFASFVSAGLGVRISVSEASLARAGKLLNKDAGVGNGDPAQTACRAVENSRDGQASQVIGNGSEDSKESWTFATSGRGSKVSLSAASMENAKEILRDSSYGAAPVASFQTAGTGSKVSISDASIKNAQKILREPSSHAASAISFHTAGAGKNVSISDTSIENARKILRDPSSAATSAVSFHTAGAGKKVSISDASIANAQEILRDSSSGATPAVSFLTSGAGKEISISDASIETAQKLLHHSPQIEPKFYPKSGSREVTSRRQRNLRVSFGVPELQGSGSVSSATTESTSMCAERNTVSFQHIGTGSPTTATPAFAKLPRSDLAEHSYVTPGSSMTQPHSDSGASIGVPLPTKTPNFTQHGSFEGIDTPLCAQHDQQEHTDHIPSAEEAVRTSSMLTNYNQCSRYGVPAVILEINSVNACSVFFDPESLLPIEFDAESSMKDRCLGCPDDFRNSLVELGCDSKMISDKWISNHTRWIVWKTASLERKFAHQNLGGKRLTYNRVVEALLHRYNKEIMGGARPAVRRMLNRDVSSNSMMILCVARIRRESSTEEQEASFEPGDKEIFVVELTDGWYSLPATLDNALCGFVGSGIIRIGTKLLVSNSVLSGFEEGVDPLDVAFDPFKSSCSPVLHLSANSTRIAAWYAKMGFVRPTAGLIKQDGLLLVRKVSDVVEGGGRVPLIHLTVVKRHPLMYLEQAPDGGKARILTEKEESKRIEEEEKQRQCLVERFSDDVQAECAKEIDEDAPDIWRQMIKEGGSPEFFEALDSVSKASIESWNTKRSALLRDRMQQEMQAKLEEFDFPLEPSTPFVKILVRSKDYRDNPSSEEAMLTIWKPSDDQLDILRDGNLLAFQNLDCKDARFDGMIQLTGNNGTPTSMLKDEGPQRPNRQPSITYTSLFQLQLTSKQRSQEIGLQDRRPPPVSLLGIAFNIDRRSGKRWSIYLTDESDLRLRVESDSTETAELDCFLALMKSQLIVGDEPDFRVVAFHDLRLLPFDASCGSVVAEYTAHSHFEPNPSCCRAHRLRRWVQSETGHKRLQKLALCRELGIQDRYCRGQQETIEAIGYIAGFHVLPGKPTLLLRVDCGGPIQTWRLPLSTMSAFAATCEELDKSVVLHSDEEEKMKQLTRIGRVFRARQSPFHFSLKRTKHMIVSDCTFEIANISSLDTSALAALYSAFV